jgi:hypothetical protein
MGLHGVIWEKSFKVASTMSTQLIASKPTWLTSERGISLANGSCCCSIGRTIGRVSTCSIASLTARSFGQHKALCFIHATSLRQAKYVMKTKLGLSDEGFCHCQLHPSYDPCGPCIRCHLSQSRPLLQLQIFMIGFVDDSSACINDFVNPNQSPEILLQRATADAQHWNDLLYRSGGTLEIP